MQYALPEKVKNTLSQITLSVNIRKLQVSSGKLLRLNRSIKWISVIPITANPRSTSAISIRLLWGNVLDKCMLFRI
ncbi:unknown [Bacteroides thetaiotaomicron CAG:40]|nr:unknown [Bacteroides thetaiotaomicron CAG:40]